jgi:hypothetical protein
MDVKKIFTWALKMSWYVPCRSHIELVLQIYENWNISFHFYVKFNIPLPIPTTWGTPSSQLIPCLCNYAPRCFLTIALFLNNYMYILNTYLYLKKMQLCFYCM